MPVSLCPRAGTPDQDVERDRLFAARDYYSRTRPSEVVMSFRTKIVTAVDATAVQVGLRMRLRIVAPIKNSNPRAAWSVMRRATRSLPPAPRASKVARIIPIKITKLPNASANVRKAFRVVW